MEQCGCGKSGNSFNFSANLGKSVWTTVWLTKATVLYLSEQMEIFHALQA